MPLTRLFASALLGAALAGSALRADDYQFLGFQVGAGTPVGALADWSGTRPGFALGVQQLINEGEGTMLRTHVDLLGGLKGQTEQSLPGPSGQVQASLENKFTVVSIGLDGLYFFDGDIKHGLFLLGGAGEASTRLLSACVGDAGGGAANWPASGTLTTTSNKLFWSVGLGWQCDNRIGAEIRYLNSRFSYQQVYFQNASVTAVVTFRFGMD